MPYGTNYGVTGKEVFMYTGEPYNSVTGLYSLGARFYDPTIGRFITEDSYSGDENDPMTLNLYIYARDNPERYVDLNGHSSMHVMFDRRERYDPNYSISTSTVYLDGEFVVATAESEDGYTTVITSTSNQSRRRQA